MSEVTPHDWQLADGYLLASDSPGLGIDLDEEAARQHPPRALAHATPLLVSSGLPKPPLQRNLKTAFQLCQNDSNAKPTRARELRSAQPRKHLILLIITW